MKEEYSENVRRWYDKDPILSRSMRTLELSDDKTQIQVALNIIKIIVEHNIAYSEYSGVEEIIDAVDEGLVNQGHSRWYDIDKTLRAAITMLENSEEEVQIEIAKQMAKMVIDKIKESPDENEEDDEDFDIDEEDDEDDDYQEGDYKKFL
jgi:hydrogenase maturation factor HypF (carbamoyltransferase family)